MLVLKRKVGESVQIGPDVSVAVLRLSDDWVKLGITAPPGFDIDRTPQAGQDSHGFARLGDDSPIDAPSAAVRHQAGSDEPMSHRHPLDTQVAVTKKEPAPRAFCDLPTRARCPACGRQCCAGCSLRDERRRRCPSCQEDSHG